MPRVSPSNLGNILIGEKVVHRWRLLGEDAVLHENSSNVFHRFSLQPAGGGEVKVIINQFSCLLGKATEAFDFIYGPARILLQKIMGLKRCLYHLSNQVGLALAKILPNKDGPL